MKKAVSLIAGGLLVVAAAVGVIYMKEIERAAFALNLFSGAEVSLPASFEYKGETVDVETFIAETDTVGLLVLNNGELVYERYLLTGGAVNALRG